MNNIKMGLEYELQLMVEIDNKLTIVDASSYFLWQSSRLPVGTHFDLGNIEISTIPCETYFEAVEYANWVLDTRLIPALVDSFCLKKFALFLPNPMSIITYSNDDGDLRVLHDEYPSCLKH